jgi:Mrp family chromosome partitioning ATPase
VLNEVQLLDAANELRVRGANFSKMEDAEIWIAPQKQLKAPFRAANSLLKGVLSLKQEFDFIIVDADSHQRGFPSPELINSIDGFILVVTEGQTELGEIANLRKKLVRAGGKIIGAIYNNSPREEK